MTEDHLNKMLNLALGKSNEGTSLGARNPMHTLSSTTGPINSCSPRALLGRQAFQNIGAQAAPGNRAARKKNPDCRFNTEEPGLLGNVIRSEYRTPQRTSLAQIAKDVENIFQAKNERRSTEGFTASRMPDFAPLQCSVSPIDISTGLSARRGVDRCLLTFNQISKEIRITHVQVAPGQTTSPFERVELDDLMLDIHTILAAYGLPGRKQRTSRSASTGAQFLSAGRDGRQSNGLQAINAKASLSRRTERIFGALSTEMLTRLVNRSRPALSIPQPMDRGRRT